MEGELAYMEQKAPHYEQLTDEDYWLILQALGITSADLIAGTRPTLVNTGNSFVVVGINDAGMIQGLKPDFSLIEIFSDALDLIGLYVFCFDGVGKGRDAGARMFAPRYGIQEESATGMAAGPLACYLRDHVGFDKQEFVLEQGRWMSPPSPSVLNVRLNIGANGKIERLFAGGRGALIKIAEVEF